jgi:acetyl esterase/lipase
MVHAFPLLTPLFPEAKEAFEEICREVRVRSEREK